MSRGVGGVLAHSGAGRVGVVSPFLRKVKTASGATAVQIAVKEGRRDKVIEHLGPELAHLVALRV